MKKQYYFILILFLSLYALSGQTAYTANVFFKTPSIVDTEENLDLIVNVDTGGTPVNSIELIINYDATLLSFAGYSDDNALVKLWVDPPHETKGKIYLSGIIPGGAVGLYDAPKKDKQKSDQNELSPLPLVHLLFRAKTEGTANFSFFDSKILQNDGLGTPLPHEKLTADVIIKNNSNKKITNTTAENDPEADTLKNNRETQENLSDSMFFSIMALFFFSGFIVYKLLKYRNGNFFTKNKKL